MTTPFMGEDFLLSTKAARRLYNEYARDLPIYDYHCHLPVKDIAENRQFADLTEAWLAGDHYKWRAMRANGVAERFITGDATSREKFDAWAATVPSTLRNPLFHWTHLELKRYFGIKGRILCPETARGIFDACSARLQSDAFRVRELLAMANVRVVCTTDDPTDTLEYHKKLRDDLSFPVTVIPAFRPDNAMAVDAPEAFNAWTDRLAAASGVDVKGWPAFLEALQSRHDYFHEHGCRLSDHGVEEPYAEDYTDAEIRRIFLAARKGAAADAAEARKFKSAILFELARMDADRKWTQQLHLGALRNVNSRALKLLGPNTGYDTIGDWRLAGPLARFLDRLDGAGKLPKTILYSLNPTDNAVLASMIGNFQDGSTAGKMQFGSAWWFNDHKDGMEDQLRTLSSMGLLSRFVGMLTDSRSFLSFPRHEYFRRILCNLLGGDMERGEVPMDFPLVGKTVKGICWDNAMAYFGLSIKEAVRKG